MEERSNASANGAEVGFFSAGYSKSEETKVSLKDANVTISYRIVRDGKLSAYANVINGVANEDLIVDSKVTRTGFRVNFRSLKRQYQTPKNRPRYARLQMIWSQEPNSENQKM